VPVGPIQRRVGAAAEIPLLSVAAGAGEDFRGDVLRAEQEEQGGGHVVDCRPVGEERVGVGRVGSPGRGYGRAGAGERAWVGALVVVAVEQDRLPDLTKVAGALHSVRGFASAVK